MMEYKTPVITPDQTPAGRLTRCTEKVRKDLVNAFRMGATTQMACHYAMISQATFFNWQQQVERRDNSRDLLEEKTQLFDDIAKAKGELQLYHLTQIEGAAATDWRAAAWKLERVFPRDFGPKGQLEIDAQVSSVPEMVHETFDLKALSDEQLDQVMSILDGVKTTVIGVLDSDSGRVIGAQTEDV